MFAFQNDTCQEREQRDEFLAKNGLKECTVSIEYYLSYQSHGNMLELLPSNFDHRWSLSDLCTSETSS